MQSGSALGSTLISASPKTCVSSTRSQQKQGAHFQMKVRLVGEVLVILVAFGVGFFKADSSKALPTMVFRMAEGRALTNAVLCC